MSFDTRLKITMLDDFYGIDWDAIREDILEFLDRDRIHHDFLEDIQAAFRDVEVIVNVDAEYLKSFFEETAKLFSQVSFEVRGSGEEFDKTFVQRHEDGEVIFNRSIWEIRSPQSHKNDKTNLLNSKKKYTQKSSGVLDFDESTNLQKATSKKIKYKYNY